MKRKVFEMKKIINFPINLVIRTYVAGNRFVEVVGACFCVQVYRWKNSFLYGIHE